MSYADNKSPTGISSPSQITGTQYGPPRVGTTFKFTLQLKDYDTTDSFHLGKGSPNSSSTWQPQQPCVVTDLGPDLSGKNWKRKYPGEWGTVESEDLYKKRRPPEQDEMELQCEDSGQCQMWKPPADDVTELKPKKSHWGPQELEVTEAKFEGGTQGLKRPYYMVEEGTEPPLKEKYQRLLVQLEQDDPHGSQMSRLEASKTKGCVERQRHVYVSKPHIVVSMTEHLCPVPSKTRHSEKTCDTMMVGIKLENREAGDHHLEPDSPELQICPESGNDLHLATKATKKKSILEAEEKPVSDNEGDRIMDNIFDVTEDMEKEISDALGPGPEDQILSSAFKLRITRGDMQTLKDSQWLNDEIINFYMNLLIERNKSQGYPALHAFSTFFYPKLKSGGYSSVRRWTRGVDLFAKELIFMPIHREVHWSLVVVDLRRQSIVYMDSMGQEGQRICETLFRYLQQESVMRRHVDLDPSKWNLYSKTSEEIPQQSNGSDCGMFICKYADYISKEQPLTFSQQHIPLFRRRMVWEILHQNLL